MRVFFLAPFFAFVGMCCAQAQGTAGTEPAPGQRAFEIVREDFDIEILGDGRFMQAQNIVYRPLTEQGVRALEQMQFSYTPGYEDLQIAAPFTRKKDGTRIEVARDNVLRGQGAVSGAGYEDTRHFTVVFPKVEIGDEVGLQLIRSQNQPWFPGTFALAFSFSPEITVREASISLTTSRHDTPVRVVATGLESDPDRTMADKTRRTWHFRNETPVKFDNDSVIDAEDGPRWQATTLKDYGEVARLYRDAFRGKESVTPEIRSLAGEITKGVSDKRQKAKILYDWVSTHIRYVAIVLGAGGFVPHEAGAVLKYGFGDCKDHVMLLQAMLAAEGINSSAVLIQVGTGNFKIPATPTPFAFNHLITYIPEFSLYLDSTARYEPFGTLPSGDIGRAVVIVNSGVTAKTPDTRTAGIRADTVMTLNANGSADGTTQIVATGGWAGDYRGMISAVAPDREDDFFHALLGPGSRGTLKRGNTDTLSDGYNFSVSYHIENFANLPGPGALPAQIGFKPFSFSSMIGGSFPASRASDYSCASGTQEEDLILTLPQGVSLSDIPPSRIFSTDGVTLQVERQPVEGNKYHQHIKLVVQHAGPVCKSAYYGKVHDDLGTMIRALSAQLIYR